MNAALPQAAMQDLSADTLSLRVRAIRMEAEGIHAFELVHPDGADLPAGLAAGTCAVAVALPLEAIDNALMRNRLPEVGVAVARAVVAR